MSTYTIKRNWLYEHGIVFLHGGFEDVLPPILLDTGTPGEPMRLTGYTDDAAIVALARRFIETPYEVMKTGPF